MLCGLMYAGYQMSAASPVYLEIIDFIATGATPEAVTHFQPSAAAQQRVAYLIGREKEQPLSLDERAGFGSFYGVGAHLENG